MNDLKEDRFRARTLLGVNTGIEPNSSALQEDSLSTELSGKPIERNKQR